MSTSEYKSVGQMSKKRWDLFKEQLDETTNDEELKDKIKHLLCEVLKFNPNESSYTEAQAKRIKEYRERRKQEGISVYVSSGNKARYDKQKLLKTI
jgi:hypothetical protein